MDDVLFTFDPSGFLDAINKMTNAVTKLEDKQNKMAESSNQGFGGFSKILGGMKGKLLMIGTSLLGIAGIMKGIPEIGRSFSIAGDIISRNLLWPLRQELLPYLQKMLDWVRENRAMFVRWGAVIRNVFKAIIHLGKMVLNILSKLFKGLIQDIKRIFGFSVRSMNEMVNIVIFKITAVVQFILITLEPVFDMISAGFRVALEAAGAWLDGLALGMGDAMVPIRDMVGSFQRLWSLFSRLEVSGGTLTTIFKTLGFVVGVTLRVALAVIAQTIDVLVTSIEALVNRVQYFNAWRADNTARMGNLQTEYEALNRDSVNRLRARWSAVYNETARGIRNLRSQNNNVQRTTTELTTPPTPTPTVRTTPPTETSTVRTTPQNNISNRTTNININAPVTVNETDNPAVTGDAVADHIRRNITSSIIRTGGQ